MSRGQQNARASRVSKRGIRRYIFAEVKVDAVHSLDFSYFKSENYIVMGTWHRIPCLKETLNLKATLSGGQSFRWREKSNGEWTGVVGKFVLQVRWGHEKGNGQTHLEFCALGDKATKLTTSELQSRISSYFRLDTNLEKLYEQWANCDPNFKVKATRSDLKGIRILNQEHVENIFSFICSSNNNIARISSMVENMCMLFGQEICTIDSKKYYSFPEVKDLANPNIESKLRKVGFGYRAPFVIGTAKKILEQGGEDWLLQLSEMDYANAKQELMSLPGIGAKVADCICLMSLGHLQAVPVDTHVYQIAVANYTPHLAGRKSVTSKVYNEISNHFQNLYGPMAGWAHTILFCADLRSFQEKKEEGEEEPKQANKKRKKS